MKFSVERLMKFQEIFQTFKARFFKFSLKFSDIA